MNAVMKEENHAEQNAAAWYSGIAELVVALEVDYDRLEELRDERAELESELEEARKGYADATEDERQTGEPGDELEATIKALADWDAENGDELRELTAAAMVEGDLMKDADTVRERIQEGPLSVEVRGDWHTPGCNEGHMATEFNILLSWGGPALRLMGDLDEHGEPTRAYLQYQDWGTPWTDYFPGAGSGEILLTYAQQFYFGE